MAELSAQEKAFVKRLMTDFKFFCRKGMLKIRDKSGDLVTFYPNKAQLIFLEQILIQYEQHGRVRVIVLKARQMGLSTLWGAFMYWRVSRRNGQKALVVTHEADSTRALFEMTSRYWENDPLKPEAKYAGKTHLDFKHLNGSGYEVATAGSPSVGRGWAFQCIHLSEIAFWKKSTANSILNGILKAFAGKPDTFGCIESTANGMSGTFYEFWKKTVKGENDWLPVFLPWFIQDEYRKKPPEGFTRTFEETEYCKLHDPKAIELNGIPLDDEQLFWRRMEIAETSSTDFQQEYPATAEEAFLTSGRPVFHLPTIHDMVEVAPDVIDRLGFYEGEKHEDDEPNEWQTDPRGELYVYRKLDPNEDYTIGADVAEGIPGKIMANGEREGDYSVAQVLDSKKRQVAVWRGHPDPDYFATILNSLGRYYNEAYLGVEVNNHGIHPCIMLEKHFHYPRLYERMQYDKTEEEEVAKVGFKTDQTTKPQIFAELRAAIRSKEIVINDMSTLDEMLTYIINPQGGAMEAEHGCHDDCVMALAIANHIHEGSWTPSESTEDLYGSNM